MLYFIYWTMKSEMYSLPSFSLLALLLCSAVAADDWDDWFTTSTKTICPGQSVTIPDGRAYHDRLYFKSGIHGRSQVEIANDTHVFDPSYEKKNKRVVIPEVKRQHEGTYTWESSLMPGIAQKNVQLVLKDCSVHKEVAYGAELFMALPKEAAILDFTPSGSKDQKILWSRINAEDTRGARGTISGNRWTASTMRFADAGRYTLLRESGGEISSITAKVGGRERYHDLDMYGSLEYRIGLPVSEAVVTFIDPWNKQHVIFKNGMMTEDSFRIFQNRVRLSINTELDVLQFKMSGANSKMKGRYEFTEKKGRAFVYHVHGESNEPPTIPDRILPIALAAGILTLFTFCCCVRRCCCKKKESSSPAPAPSSLPVYIHEPAPGPRPAYQPAARGPVGGTIDTPAAPSYNSSPPSYDALSANGPEPYVPYVPYAPPEAPTGAYGAPSAPDYQYQPSGWSTTDILNTSPLSMGTTDTRAPDGAGAAPAATPTPTVPSAPSAPDYQYQPRGWTGTTGDFLTVSPLNTDTTDHTEYSSAKLNF